MRMSVAATREHCLHARVHQHLKSLQKHYLNLREIIRKAAGETLDLKPYEADMRHLIDTYIEAQAPRKISPFDGISLLDLIVKTGIANTIAERLSEMKGNEECIAETIENNVRSKILKEQLTDPAYFARMSAVLDEIIRLRKEKAIEYEDYLARIADVARRVSAGKVDDTPVQLKTSGQLALYNNLKDHVATDAVQELEAPYAGKTIALDMALKLDAVINAKRPDGWRGVVAKEQMVKQAMFEVLRDIKEVNRLLPSSSHRKSIDARRPRLGQVASRWIRTQQRKFQAQERETPREFLNKEATTCGVSTICWNSALPTRRQL